MDKSEEASKEPYQSFFNSPMLEPTLPFESQDHKYLTQLSTMLVASIQDARDHISQIEYIFCSQLFPNFQSNSRKLQNLLENALEIDQLRLENRRISEENRVLRHEELEAKRRRVDELEREKELRGSAEKRKMLESEVERFEKERKVLLGKIDDLDEKLRASSREIEEMGRSREKLRLENEDLLEKVKCLEERIGERVECLESELESEKTKRNRLTESYKRLKSQHNYLRKKVGLSEENMIQQNKSEDLCNTRSRITEHVDAFENSDTSVDVCEVAKVKIEIPEEDLGGLENKSLDVFVTACETIKVKEKASQDNKRANLSPPPSIFRGVPKCPSSTKPVSVSGIKRPASSWRQTRAHQSRAGPDLHDDFLDTPLENIRENLNRDLNKEDPPDIIDKEIVMNSSDDETQDLSSRRRSPLKKQSSITVANKRSFKYIEPVRKKAERENLKGVECKQCRKFYEAVLPNGDGKDPDGSNQNLRCEHHDGVSRHRYRYVPPMTPEGFWNIGFESEM